jgi:type IV pilus assembly protein PilM
MMKKYFQRFLPEKKVFTGVEIGTEEIKAAEIKIIDGYPEAAALRRLPSPPGVWTDQFDEESLVQALKEICPPQGREVITCIGGEKAFSRIVKLPRMSDKELRSALRFEIQKFVPTPADQLVIRCIRLGKMISAAANKRAGAARDDQDTQERDDLLILAVPLTTVYQYHSIFSRAGFTVTAVDLQAFALWRVFGRNIQGAAAVVDIGARTSCFVLIKDGLIRFIRHLPAGSEMISEVAKELQRSFDYCAAHEDITVEKLILSGKVNDFAALSGQLRQDLGISAAVGAPEADFSIGGAYDPAYAVSIGLALREVSSHVLV